MKVMLDHEPKDSDRLEVGDVVRLVDKGIYPAPATDMPNGVKGLVNGLGQTDDGKPRVHVTMFVIGAMSNGVPRIRSIPQSLHPDALERIP